MLFDDDNADCDACLVEFLGFTGDMETTVGGRIVRIAWPAAHRRGVNLSNGRTDARIEARQTLKTRVG